MAHVAPWEYGNAREYAETFLNPTITSSLLTQAHTTLHPQLRDWPLQHPEHATGTCVWRGPELCWQLERAWGRKEDRRGWWAGAGPRHPLGATKKAAIPLQHGAPLKMLSLETTGSPTSLQYPALCKEEPEPRPALGSSRVRLRWAGAQPPSEAAPAHFNWMSTLKGSHKGKERV